VRCQVLFLLNWYFPHHVLLSSDFLLQEHVRRLDPRARRLGDDDYYLALTLGG
jgi:hypothetical protein